MEEVTKRETVIINEIEYYVDTLTKSSMGILQDMNIVNTELKKIETSFNIVKLAKEALLSKLLLEVDNFERVKSE